MKKVIALVLLALLTAAGAAAGTLSPGLERLIGPMDGDAPLTVLVVMEDQVDVQALDWELHDAKATRAVRHRTVVESLRSLAESTQRGLLADLEADKAAGAVRGYTPHWLINAVVVATTVDGARRLAARPDVAVVEPDLEVELIEPVASAKDAAKDGRGVGITPGVVAVGARRVWDELGIDGSGTIVGVLDTGVDGTHPALGARWRGTVAPADECWLDAAGLGDATPVDQHYHGTHVMGTITGLAADDTIGVAPGALWIASNVINMSSGSAFDNAVIASLEFMADPDGNPATSDDVPDVVQNSWGVNESFSGYVDCDSRWWTAIDACEAAGVVLTWSAGNEGPGSTTVRSPADRATSAFNAFSVGSTLPNAPYDISSFSSRGPTGCGGVTETIKPEISAPGSDIYSAEPGGGYQFLSGTSMAGPHVAGVVALMRAANPGLDVITIKQILMDTAVDLGAAGEDNDYGHGFVDAYTAVLSVMSGFGTVAGTVLDAGAGGPLADVAITAVAPGETDRAATTDATGAFQMMLPEGDWTLTYTLFGYDEAAASVTVVADQTVAGDAQLTAKPTATLSGVVRDEAGDPIAGAGVGVIGAPVTPATTDAAGAYALDLPVGATYEVLAQAAGYGGDQRTVVFGGPATQDFTLPDLIIETFESNSFATFPWQQAGDAPWTIDASVSYQGTHSARSGDITDNQTSTLSLDVEVLAAGPLEFEARISSESNYDFLTFSVDGTVVESWSGEVDWTHVSVPLDAGPHTLAWSYAKDASVSNGSDAAWIDDVIFPALVPPAYPDIAVAPASLDHTQDPGTTSQHVIDLDNVGEADLVYTAVAAVDGGGPAAAAPAPRPKGAEDDAARGDPLLGSGGPDGFGYTWIDSDEVGGPAYGWIDIGSVGTPLSLGDDDSGSVAFSFPFPFYGTDYTAVNVCSNGFLSFVDGSTAYTNAPIPSTSQPNGLVAVFWDDLNPSAGGTILAYDDTANDRLVVSWEGVPHYGTTDAVDFQVILNADGSILCQYRTIVEPDGCTIGLENAGGSDGLPVVYNAAYAADGLALLFSTEPPPTPWLSVAPAGGTIPAGGAGQLTVTLDATDLAEGVYTGSITVASNDPDETVVVVPVSLTVSTVSSVAAGLPSRPTLDGAAPNPFNPRTEIAYAIPAGGARVRLEIYDVSGRLVKRLVAGPKAEGRHTATWDGEDGEGRRVASGTYFYRLSAGPHSQTRAFVLLK